MASAIDFDVSMDDKPDFANDLSFDTHLGYLDQYLGILMQVLNYYLRLAP